jgi:hypothetical protein
MADEGDSAAAFDTNPLVTRLLDAGGEGAVALTGFLAPSTREGYVRLFPGLDDMTRSIEIAERDVLHTVELPKSDLGAVAVWVRKDADIHHHRIEKLEVYVARSTAGGRLTSVRRSGLGMRVRAQARDVCTCEYYCDGTQCVPCTSNCLRTEAE